MGLIPNLLTSFKPETENLTKKGREDGFSSFERATDGRRRVAGR